MFAPIWQLANKDITTLQAGDFNSGAIGADGSVYLWGRCGKGAARCQGQGARQGCTCSKQHGAAQCVCLLLHC
jgi:alpha-tubulin suppressor-like RCC1 family protein